MSLTKLEQRILNFLQENSDKSYRTQDLANEFNYNGKKNYKKLIKALAYLGRIDEIHLLDNGQVKAKGVLQSKVTGTFRSNDRGFGFVKYDPDQPDLFIPPGKTGPAMNDDIVEVTILKQVNPETGKGSEARVDRVVERSASQLVGEFFVYDKDQREAEGYLGYVMPQGDYSPETKVYVLEEGIHPVDHSIVVIKIKDYPTDQSPHKLTGYVAKEIGHRDAPGVDILAILYQFNIPHEFPENVLAEAEAIPMEVLPEELNGRRDLRDQLIMTIDGADAKDIDDAIAIERVGANQYKLWVHIADVAHYVREGSAIDREAFARGTSVYLTDRVVPMLPQRLSNGICSLLPDEDRLAVTCEMIIDSKGTVQEHDIYLSVINSKHRMTYTDVNAILNGDEGLRQEYHEIVPELETMAELHEILEQMRHRRGALNFDSPEAEFVVDKDGHPLDIIVRERFTGERLIESFMLVANETIARHYTGKDLPFLYRVHEQPDADRMQNFAEFVTAFGLVLRGNVESIQPKQLQEALAQIEDTPYSQVVSMMMLRSMQQARYSEEPFGHYGLAATDYTHFTAPIRRYPDLTVHRLIHDYLKGRPTAKVINRWEQLMPDIAEQSSKMERRSVDAERETDALKKAEYMQDKIGQQFEGIISSVTSFGMFVQLDNTVEGLITIQELPGDYYRYDSRNLVLIGDRTNQIFRIGQRVLIEVEKVSIEEREIDFNLVEAYPTDNSGLAHLTQEKNRDQRKNQAKGKGRDRGSNKNHPAKNPKRGRRNKR